MRSSGGESTGVSVQWEGSKLFQYELVVELVVDGPQDSLLVVVVEEGVDVCGLSTVSVGVDGDPAADGHFDAGRVGDSDGEAYELFLGDHLTSSFARVPGA